MVQYTVRVEILKSRHEVWNFIVQPDNLVRWSPFLTEVKTMSGDPQKKGSLLNLTFKEGKKVVNLEEKRIDVVQDVRLRSLFTGKKMRNLLTFDLFIEDEKTICQLESAYSFEGLMKFIGPLAKSFLIKRSQLQLDKLKRAMEEPAA